MRMSDPPPSKRRKVNKDSAIPGPVPGTSFLSLSDDVLLLVFQNLSSHQLLTVAETCSRFQRVCQDASLWKHPDFTGSPPMDLKSIKKCVRLLHSRTESLALEGFLRSKGAVTNLSEALLVDISKTAENLQTLKLHNCFIHGDQIGFEHFPKTLKHLSLDGCEIDNLPGDRSYFKNIHKHLPLLESLCLSGCGWVKNHCLMAICKLENLQVLNLRGCFRIGECFAYTALATRFGFNQVESFDLRETNITDTELACFGRKEKLKELLVGGESAHTISDRGILSICALVDNQPPPTALERLTLHQTRVTDQGLQTLGRGLKTLRYLDVRGSTVTEEGVTAFMSHIENCKVITEFVKPT